MYYIFNKELEKINQEIPTEERLERFISENGYSKNSDDFIEWLKMVDIKPEVDIENFYCVLEKDGDHFYVFEGSCEKE